MEGRSSFHDFFKKGNKEDLLNYRGIALVNNLTKIFTHILKNQLESWAETNDALPESQLGFAKAEDA